MALPRLAVIQFPGSNCEYETRRAAAYYGFDAQVVRWNDTETIGHYDAYILPGGFSYQDRVRAGAISAKLPVMSIVAEGAFQGKPVLGICNGCQILAETGLIAGVSTDTVEVGMAPNTRDSRPVGFICDWRYVTVTNPSAGIFTRHFNDGDVLPIPINHGEGRFVLSRAAQERLPQLATFRYCAPDGSEAGKFPENPNGAYENLAGICSQNGNVLGIMPHPERSAFLKQVPISIQGQWQQRKRDLLSGGSSGPGPMEKLFVAMVEYAKERR
ncbi:phosphoribosylformylglycinamidine synthase I [bacterium]|nr:phosphoribosylformylglycinamidine synthase I [bacterium]